MSVQDVTAPVPHSIGLNRPVFRLPENACDSHMHIFDPRFTPSPHWKRTPPVATVEAYRLLQGRLGTTRTVVVNPSTYGTDNACTLDALDRLGDCARGVAVVSSEVDDRELDQLDARRVRGLRVNFVTPQSWGATTPEMLRTLARKVARLGWHVQVFVHPEQLIDLEETIRSAPVPVVIDHMARIDPEEGTASPAYKTLRRLLDDGNTWVKLSGAYMRSGVGEPSYADTWSLGTALVQAAPQRLVWGTDWPHTTQPADTVNDAHLLDLLHRWAGGKADTLQRILVDNPARLYGFDR